MTDERLEALAKEHDMPIKDVQRLHRLFKAFAEPEHPPDAPVIWHDGKRQHSETVDGKLVDGCPHHDHCPPPHRRGK